jgi:hypothetical protein
MCFLIISVGADITDHEIVEVIEQQLAADAEDQLLVTAAAIYDRMDIVNPGIDPTPVKGTRVYVSSTFITDKTMHDRIIECGIVSKHIHHSSHIDAPTSKNTVHTAIVSAITTE